jgi:hypothetical protein
MQDIEYQLFAPKNMFFWGIPVSKTGKRENRRVAQSLTQSSKKNLSLRNSAFNSLYAYCND